MKLLRSLLLAPWTRWVVSAVLLSILIWMSDLSQIQESVSNAQVGWLFLAFLLSMTLTVFGALKWWVLMPRSRNTPITFVRVNFVSNFVGIFFPGIVGIEAARIAGITKSSKDLPAAFASVLVDRVFGLLTLAIAVAVGGITASELVPDVIQQACVVSLVVLILIVFLTMNITFRNFLARILPGKLYNAAEKVFECLDLYRNQKKVLFLSLILSLIFQFLRVIMVFCLAISLDITVSLYYLLIVVPIALFVQMLPISVYGMGIRESAIVTLLAVIGVTTEKAIALSLLLFAIQIAGAFPGGILFALGHKLPEKHTT